MTAPANLPPRPGERRYARVLEAAGRSMTDVRTGLDYLCDYMQRDANALEARIRAAGDDADMSEDVRLHIDLCDDARVLSDAVDALRSVMRKVEGVQLACEDREKMAAMVAAMEGKP